MFWNTDPTNLFIEEFIGQEYSQVMMVVEIANDLWEDDPWLARHIDILKSAVAQELDDRFIEWGESVCFRDDVWTQQPAVTHWRTRLNFYALASKLVDDVQAILEKHGDWPKTMRSGYTIN